MGDPVVIERVVSFWQQEIHDCLDEVLNAAPPGASVRIEIVVEEAEAARIHRCPDGYEGPCWGPTRSDYERARANLAAGVPGDPK